MKHKFRWDKKYLYWGFTAFCVIAASVLFYLLITHFPDISGAMRKLGKILSPFIWGLVIAYLLSPLMQWMDRRLFLPLGRKLFKKTKKKGAGFARVFSILLSLLLCLLNVPLSAYNDVGSALTHSLPGIVVMSRPVPESALVVRLSGIRMILHIAFSHSCLTHWRQSYVRQAD